MHLLCLELCSVMCWVQVCRVEAQAVGGCEPFCNRGVLVYVFRLHVCR